MPAELAIQILLGLLRHAIGGRRDEVQRGGGKVDHQIGVDFDLVLIIGQLREIQKIDIQGIAATRTGAEKQRRELVLKISRRQPKSAKRRVVAKTGCDRSAVSAGPGMIHFGKGWGDRVNGRSQQIPKWWLAQQTKTVAAR